MKAKAFLWRKQRQNTFKDFSSFSSTIQAAKTSPLCFNYSAFFQQRWRVEFCEFITWRMALRFIQAGNCSAHFTTQSVLTGNGIREDVMEAKISFAHHPGVIRRLRRICMNRDKLQIFTVMFTHYYIWNFKNKRRTCHILSCSTHNTLIFYQTTN